MTLYATASKALALGSAGLGAAAAHRYQNLLKQESQLPTQQLWKFDNTKALTGKRKQVVVVGGGVVGVTAAYKLAQAGHSVALLEPRKEPGKECSACAAGGMQRSNPTVDKDSWIATLKCIAPSSRYILGGDDEPYKFFHIDWWATLSDPFFLRWVATFTRTSLFPPADQKDKQKEMLSFTNYAVDDMVKMMDDRKDNMSTKSGFNPNGSLSLSYTPPVQEKAPAGATKNPTASKWNYEPSKQLTGEEIIVQEPSIRYQEQQPTTAKFEYESSAASSQRFTEELAARCATDPTLDVTFLYDTTVKAVKVGTSKTGKPRVSELKTNRGVIDIPENAQVVVAAGAWTSHIMAFMDLYAPVYPLKGYAMSVSAAEALKDNKNLKPQDLPSRVVSDKYMYTSRLGDEVRITSIGEFSGWSTKPSSDVEAEFHAEAIRQFPQLAEEIIKAPTRCGHRPYVSDGILLLGRVDTHENLFVSCGPGSNGWKLAMGSGDIIERLIAGQTEDEISKELEFDAHSFSPAGRVLKSPLFAKLCRSRWNV